MQLIEQGRGVREGYCATTTADVIGDCDQGDQGSINLPGLKLMTPQMAARRCLQLCFECTRCKHISFTALQQGGERSWYHACPRVQTDMPHLNFTSFTVRSLSAV